MEEEIGELVELVKKEENKEMNNEEKIKEETSCGLLSLDEEKYRKKILFIMSEEITSYLSFSDTFSFFRYLNIDKNLGYSIDLKRKIFTYILEILNIFKSLKIRVGVFDVIDWLEGYIDYFDCIEIRIYKRINKDLIDLLLKNFKDLKLDNNICYMYTNIKVPYKDKLVVKFKFYQNWEVIYQHKSAILEYISFPQLYQNSLTLSGNEYINIFKYNGPIPEYTYLLDYNSKCCSNLVRVNRCFINKNYIDISELKKNCSRINCYCEFYTEKNNSDDLFNIPYNGIKNCKIFKEKLCNFKSKNNIIVKRIKISSYLE